MALAKWIRLRIYFTLTAVSFQSRSFTLLRRKPWSLRPWMNAERVPFEALKERSRVCFGGFRLPARSRFGEGRPSEACGGATGFSPWGSTFGLSIPVDCQSTVASLGAMSIKYQKYSSCQAFCPRLKPLTGKCPASPAIRAWGFTPRRIPWEIG
jgi:hypothetical protein